MGCTTSQIDHKNKSQNSIHVATLNYGGILNSPFEFYSDQQAEEKEISRSFKALIPEYYKDFDEKTFSWKIGKIDQKIQKERYTPIYSPTAGIENGKLISAAKFKEKWQTNFDKALPKAKLEKQPTKEEIEFMQTFDLICYHTLLRHLYSINKISEKEDHDATEYGNLLKKYFGRSYLDEKKKLQLMEKLLNHEIVDVFFFQEPTSVLVDKLKQNNIFKVFEGGKDNSIIAVRNSSRFGQSARSFEEIKKTGKISAQKAQKIEANPQTRIVFANKIIFVCVHLSSKAQKNKKELEELKEGMNALKEAFPEHEFIIGGDTNAFIPDFEIKTNNYHKKLEIYPGKPELITTCKTRTFLQPQFNKAEKPANDCKDQFISSLQMGSKLIATIDMKKQEEQLNLPTDNHPFDHMLVFSEFNLQKEKSEIKE